MRYIILLILISSRVWGIDFTNGFEEGTIAGWCYPGTFNAGPPEFCSGNNGGNAEISGVGTTTIETSVVHSGTKSLKLQISTPNTPTSGVRMFRWLEPRANQKGTYSIWINIPQRYTLTGNPSNGHFVNIFQFKSADGAGRIDPIWAFHINDADPNHWYLQAVWGDGGFTGAGPYSSSNVSRKVYTQTIAELPVGQWVHLEAYLEQSNSFGGRLIMRQDNVQIFDFTSIKTSYNNCNYNSWCADDEWAVNIYSDGLTPDPAYLYIDDAQILNATTPPVVISGTVNSLAVYEIDNVAQTNRVVEFGRVFTDAENIAACPQPLVDGTAITAGNWQADVKNRHASTNVKYAVISFKTNFTARQGHVITFQNATCDNTALTQIQMVNFLVNSGTWEASTDITANGTTKTTLAKTMLQNTDPAGNPECGNTYLRKGPVVTTVEVKDCTFASIYDFGWLWNGITMSTPVTGNAPTASLHPTYILSFYSTPNKIKVEHILESAWTGRYQDQQYTFVLKTASAGNPLVTWFDHSGALFTHVGRTRWRKIGWSGTKPGNIRINPNFTWLIATKVLPNYDLTRKVSVNISNTNNFAYSLADFKAGDKADICPTCIAAGRGSATPWGGSYAANGEGTILQREDLLYLYNSSSTTSFDGLSCGDANSQCASAWYMLTGESGLIDTNLPAISGGGAGIWNMVTHVPYHTRESRVTTNGFYCSNFGSKDASLGDSCGTATGNATGKVFSRHAYPTTQNAGPGTPPVTAVGFKTSGGWDYDIAHWLDYSYLAYLLTGDYFWQEEEFLAAGSILSFTNSTPRVYGSAQFFAAFNVTANGYRSAAWPLQTVARAAYIATDGTPEKTYFTSMLDSSIAIYEGILGVQGTTLTPSSTNSACTGFVFPNSATTANRWNLGHCEWTQASLNSSIVPGIRTLHNLGEVACSSTGEILSFFNINNSRSNGPIWQRNQLGISLGHIYELGFTEVLAVAQHIWKTPVEMVLDSGYNPYLVGSYKTPTAGIAQPCGNSNGATFSSNTYFQTLADVKNGYLSSVQAVNGFNTTQDTINGNVRCADHAYSVMARAALTFAKGNSIVGSCSQGDCTAANAWLWAVANIPFFTDLVNAPNVSCTGDYHIKFALAPRAVTTSNCVITESAALPSASLLVPYSKTIATTGCLNPTFNLFSGTLPAGLTLSSSGTISGTPTSTAFSSFNIVASDVFSSDGQDFTLNVLAELIIKGTITIKGSIIIK